MVLLGGLCWLALPVTFESAAQEVRPGTSISPAPASSRIQTRAGASSGSLKPASSTPLAAPVTPPQSAGPTSSVTAPAAHTGGVIAGTTLIQGAAADAFVAQPVQTVLEAQIYLARLGISPGPIDGLMGGQTRSALRAFQQARGLPQTGELDATTRAPMWLVVPPMTNFVASLDDLSRLRPVPKTWLGKSQATSLDYENLVELVAEKGWAYQSFVRKLNPLVDWSRITNGVSLQLPHVWRPRFDEKAAQIRIFLAQRVLQAFAQDGRLLVHFPCSIAQRVDKRPVGELRVSVLAPDPDYTFDPEVFTESEEARQLGRKLRIPPGPNNPVGLAWIGLSLPGYGIHGTPDPEKVGRTESHGCFRLANWNARTLLELAWEGLPVVIEP